MIIQKKLKHLVSIYTNKHLQTNFSKFLFKVFNLANNYEEEKTMLAIEDYKKELKLKHTKTRVR